MTDLSSIPTEELLRDRQESINDAFFCHIALDDKNPLVNLEETQQRLEGNMEMVRVVSIELRERGIDWI